MASKRVAKKPKYKVGQVVRWIGERYVQISMRFVVSEGIGRGLRWHYNLYNPETGQCWADKAESDVRPLTKRERG